MGILLGLLTALSWGGGDFIARLATHRIGALRSLLYMQLVGFLLLSLALPWLGGWGHLADGSGWQPWAWGALAGVFNVFSSFALYRAFEIGKMAVVAPLSASYPALTLLFSWLGGDRLSHIRIAGIIVTLLGVMVVAGGEHVPGESGGNGGKPQPKNTRGLGSALGAAIGFGVLFWLLGVRVIPRVGATQTVWIIRLTSTVLTVGMICLLKQPIRLPGGSVRWMALGMGFFDSGAFVLSNRGMQMEQVAVISVLGSLYGAVTVGLATIFLREHVSRWQWAGIATIFAGIYLISR
ncbi:MAG TPA: EamA family transporter [Candidatus Angelobacter sp.]|nr:EamA family transporter [Candidatus Angelobacter sp.]